VHLTYYALPAIFALMAKAGIFFYARYSNIHNSQTRVFLLFLFSLSIQNVAEILFFVTNLEELHNAGRNGWIWYGASILALAFILHLTILTATSWRGRSDDIPLNGAIFLYAPALVLELLLWTSDLLVIDFESMAYTVTQVPGPLYFLFRVYAVVYMCASIGMLIYGSSASLTAIRRLQNRFLLVGLIPSVVLSIAILALRFAGSQSFNATATLPLTFTFFLAITAYATHQHRLFDIELFLPWSKIRKRKTAFYKRIQSLIAEIAEMSSVQRIIHSISNTLRCPVALIGGPTPSLAIAGEAFGIARFPLEELRKVSHILVANEITETMPTMYAAMKRHHVAAIVPFHPHSQAAASWMLLGDAFSEQVYSPLDFKTVETLFARLADHFLDNQLLLRSQLLEARREMDALHARLAHAWEQIETMRRQLAETTAENQQIRQQESAASNRDLATIQSDTTERHAAERSSLDEQVAEYEARLIAKTLDHCGGDVSRTAELLGLPIGTLHGKLRQIANRENDPPEPQVLFV